jgi:hypothetical protein
VLGVFPIFGLPTVLCAAAALVFRLNLPAIQLVNQICSPFQYLLFIPLGRAGARIVSQDGGGTGMFWNLLHAARNAVVGWCCYCVPAGLLLYLLIAFTLRWRRQACSNRLESPA